MLWTTLAQLALHQAHPPWHLPLGHSQHGVLFQVPALACALPLGRPVIHWPAARGLHYHKRDQTSQRVSSGALCSALLCAMPLLTCQLCSSVFLPASQLNYSATTGLQHLIPAVETDSSRNKFTRFLKLNTDLIWSAVHIRKYTSICISLEGL